MSSFTAGRRAEAQVSKFLQQRGCTIVANNWRTRYCEIDVIAIRKRVLYFVEVKYRSSNRQGSGLDYITPRKLRQMQFAAELWLQSHRWLGAYQLIAFEVSGPDFSQGRLVRL